jgi:type VI secretion system protein ImpF
MAELTPIERLQPCLLDRLTDDEPGKTEESRAQRVISLSRYRKGVLRDLEWLFNTNAYLAAGIEDFDLRDYPEAWRSVLNFGVLQLCGQTSPNLQTLQQDLSEAIEFFEPRITPRSLVIRADKERNNILLDIDGDLWAHPMPDHLHLTTVVDIETGQCIFGDAPYGSPTA